MILSDQVTPSLYQNNFSFDSALNYYTTSYLAHMTQVVHIKVNKCLILRSCRHQILTLTLRCADGEGVSRGCISVLQFYFLLVFRHSGGGRGAEAFKLRHAIARSVLRHFAVHVFLWVPCRWISATTCRRCFLLSTRSLGKLRSGNSGLQPQRKMSTSLCSACLLSNMFAGVAFVTEWARTVLTTSALEW